MFADCRLPYARPSVRRSTDEQVRSIDRDQLELALGSARPIGV